MKTKTEMRCVECDSIEVYATTNLYWNGADWELPLDPEVLDPTVCTYCPLCGDSVDTYEKTKLSEVAS